MCFLFFDFYSGCKVFCAVGRCSVESWRCYLGVEKYRVQSVLCDDWLEELREQSNLVFTRV